VRGTGTTRGQQNHPHTEGSMIVSNAVQERTKAAQLPEGDVIRTLLEQHARIRDLFKDVSTAEGDHKQQAFDELRALLAVHETAEEMVLRPVSKKVAGEQVADARNHEEHEANEVLAKLEKMDVASPDFDAQLAKFEKAVSDHADHEENDEFPHVMSTCDEEERIKMGKRIRAAESVAPTHPHPSTAGSTPAQWSVGPFAALVDRTRDLITKAG
jgi:hemerythrin superfamily protein